MFFIVTKHRLNDSHVVIKGSLLRTNFRGIKVNDPLFEIKSFDFFYVKSCKVVE